MKQDNTTVKKIFHEDRTLGPHRNKTLSFCHVSKLRNFELPGGRYHFNCCRLRWFHTPGTIVDVTIEIAQP